VNLEKAQAKNKWLKYCGQLLENLADELNIQQVRFSLNSTPPAYVIYKFDTLKGRGVGFSVEVDNKTVEAPNTILIVLTGFFKGNTLEDMAVVRSIISEGLRQRAVAGIKLRQPLSAITINESKND
jgi:hypothetical protein